MSRKLQPQIVVLGNLLPADDAVDELDSWMFQTVGHQLVAGYAAACGLPLLRRRIRGASRHTVNSICLNSERSKIHLVAGYAAACGVPLLRRHIPRRLAPHGADCLPTLLMSSPAGGGKGRVFWAATGVPLPHGENFCLLI